MVVMNNYFRLIAAPFVTVSALIGSLLVFAPAQATGQPSNPTAVIAHRGLHAGFTHGNTPRAIEVAARNRHVDIIEFDVRLSRDGVPFVWHNWTFPGSRKPAISYTWSQISKKRPYGQRVLSLHQALYLIKKNGNARPLIELKDPGRTPQVFWKVPQLLWRTKMAHRSLIEVNQGVDVPRLERYWHRARTVVVGLKHRPYISQYRGYHGLAVNYRQIDGGYSYRVRASGLKLYAWTSKSRSVSQRMRDLHVSGIMVDTLQTW